jgi:putative inorganic carbon (hco3(-)) transporter
MAFFFFILVNATLFIRPAEFVPALLGWELYFYFIVVCLILAVPDVLAYFTDKSLLTQPVTLAVLGLLPCVFLAGIIANGMSAGWRSFTDLAKIIIYYLLFVSLVTTTARFRILVICILVCCGAMTMVAVLRYHEVIELAAVKPLKEGLPARSGASVTIDRLGTTGIFGDPNDLCVMLAAMVPLCLYFVMADSNIGFRAAGAGLLPLFIYAIHLTHSRGGFLALVVSLGALFWTAYGWKKTAIIGIIGLPLLLIVFGGRQTEIDVKTNTATSRIHLWNDWLWTFRENMFFGNGIAQGADEEALPRAVDDIRLLAHNAYLQGFADLGFVGGCLFLGAFGTSIWSLYRLNARACVQIDRDAKRLQPFVLACVLAYCIGMLTLSIGYIAPTYMILAVAASYTRIAHRTCLSGPPPLRVNFPMLAGVAAAGVGYLACLFIFVRLFA